MKKPLENYYKIVRGEKKAKFLNADLDSKIKEVKEIMKNCYLCERKCGANRWAGEKGFCKVLDKCLVSSEFLHYGEENFFVPSHTIFFMGCTFSCQYCQNWSISHWIESGTEVSPKWLAERIKIRKRQGAKNINFVGGEPTPYLLCILETLKILQKEKRHSTENVNLPVVWNSNFYMSKETMKIIKDIVDVYLPDFKYGNNKCALRLSKVPKYFETVSRNHIFAIKNGEMCIRHLVLPNHVECCTLPVLKWIAENLGKKVVVNIMNQYRPEFIKRGN